MGWIEDDADKLFKRPALSRLFPKLSSSSELFAQRVQKNPVQVGAPLSEVGAFLLEKEQTDAAFHTIAHHLPTYLPHYLPPTSPSSLLPSPTTTLWSFHQVPYPQRLLLFLSSQTLIQSGNPPRLPIQVAHAWCRLSRCPPSWPPCSFWGSSSFLSLPDRSTVSHGGPICFLMV